MLSTCACTDTSSAEVGSSQTRNSGCVASARAIEMRWRWPPENWCGTSAACPPPPGPPIAAARPARRPPPGRPARPMSAAARRRCRAPASAGSGWRTGPGRSSACAAAAPTLRRRPAGGVGVLSIEVHAPRWRYSPPAAAPPCSAAARLAHQRQRAPRSIAKLTPSTACTNWRGGARHAFPARGRDVEGLQPPSRSGHFHQRDAPSPSVTGNGSRSSARPARVVQPAGGARAPASQQFGPLGRQRARGPAGSAG